jgi:hypothetical protein
MAVAWYRNPVLDDTVPLVDRDQVNERTFGVTTTRRHPRYVYSVRANSCLMHRIVEVEIQWYAFVGINSIGRLKQPAMIAHTACGMSKALTPDRSRTCAVPLPGSALCGRCHGEPATFGAQGAGAKAGLSRQAAGVRLGCEVAGYPQSKESSHA